MEKESSEIVKLTERIAKDPKSKLFVPLAEEYKKVGDIEMAIHVLTEGLRNNPGYITARSSLGRLLLERGDLTGAQKELEEVIKAIPDNLLAQRKLGDIYILQGRSSDALQRFRMCLTLNPGDKELASLIADLDAGKDVSSRIARPKVLITNEGAKQPDAAAAATPSSVKSEPPRPAALSSAAPAASAPQPAGEQAVSAQARPAAPSPTQTAPAPVAPAAVRPPAAEPAAGGAAPSRQDEVEIVEEIVELEAVEPPAEAPLASEGPALAADAAAGQQQGLESVVEGLFDLTEPAAEAAPAEENQQAAAAWDDVQQPAAEEQPASAAVEPSDDINTNTLADLYTAQGFYEKAIEIYQGMLAENPGNAALEQKISAIQAMAGISERSGTLDQEETPGEGLQAAGAPPALDVLEEQEAHQEAEAPGLEQEPPAAGKTEPSAAPEAGRSLPEAPAVFGTAPQEPLQSMPPEPASVIRDAQPAPGSDANPLLTPLDAATRRQATIERLESWLKNVIKEKP
jgi:tetratricopeptide (TPR) repeat protein